MGKILTSNFIFICIILCFQGIAKTNNTPFEINQRLGQGINMGNCFEAPAETEWGNPWNPDYFRIMSELGFSHVRIPVRWSTPERSMNQPPYTIDPDFMTRIQNVVDTALKYNLHAIINMHHHNDLFEDPQGQKDRFLAQWEQIAVNFQDYPDSLVFEVLNEPHNNLNPEMWNTFFNDALQVIRPTNPERVVMVGTAPWGGIPGVENLVLPEDDNLILTIHYYNPFQFTHQGAGWVGEHTNDWLGTPWLDTEIERLAVINEFELVREFSQENNIPVHVGEFGATGAAPMDSRIRWTRFMARYFDEMGYSWAYWEFSAGFGIYKPDSQTFNQGLVDALLNDPMPQPTGFNTNPIFEDDFQEGTTNWNLWENQGASANLTEDTNLGQVEIEIVNTGTENWHLQFVMNDLTLEKNQIYMVEFTAKTVEGETTIGSTVGKNYDPWDSYSGNYSFLLSEEFSNHSYSFYMIQDTDPDSRLVFDLGLSNGTIIFDKIKIGIVDLQTDSKGALNEIQGISLYPNPAKDYLTYEYSGLCHVIEIFNLSGKLVIREKKNHLQPQTIKLDNMNPGIYVFQLTDQDQVIARKFIKK